MTGSRIVGAGPLPAVAGASPTTTSPRWSTPTTSGSATGSASPTRRIADSETVADMATAAAEKALADSGLTAADIDLVVVATCSSVDRCPNVATRVAARLGITAPGRVRPQHRLLRLLLRAGHRRPRDPGRRRPQRPGDRRREALRLHRLDRPVHLQSSSATAPAPPWSPRSPTASSPASARCVWGSAPDKGDAVRIEGWQPVHPAGGPDGLPLGHHRARPARARGLRAGRRRARASSPRSCRTRPTPHHRRHRQAARPAQRRRSPRTSSSPATPRRRACRWPCPSWSSAGEVPSGAPVLLFGFGGGLTYAGQVVRCP